MLANTHTVGMENIGNKLDFGCFVWVLFREFNGELEHTWEVDKLKCGEYGKEISMGMREGKQRKRFNEKDIESNKVIEFNRKESGKRKKLTCMYVCMYGCGGFIYRYPFMFLLLFAINTQPKVPSPHVCALGTVKA